MQNLNKKKELAARTFGVGVNKIFFDTRRLNDVKEAITKQDMRDLLSDGAISIKENIGRKMKEKSKTRRGVGKIKIKKKKGKREYVILVRKLRIYVGELRLQGKIPKEQFYELRKKIKARAFKDKSHLKETLGGKS